VVSEEPELSNKEIKLLAASMLMERAQLARLAGITFDGKRDLYNIFGYSRSLTTADYRERFERGGVAGKVVEALPNATWRGGVELQEDEDPEIITEFEAAWYALENKHHVVAKMLQADILSRLSTYSIILIGAPGKLDSPLPKGKGDPTKLLYFQAYMGAGGPNAPASSGSVTRDGRQGTEYVDATIAEFDLDTESERFGMPTSYKIRRTDFSSPDLQTPVHWSRVVHVAESPMSDEVYGRPCLARVWNLFDDLEKVTGGGAEAFFQRAHQGRVWSIDKDVQGLSEPEMQKFRDEIEQFQHGLTRDVRVRGVTVQPLGSDVAQFGPNADAIITQISGSTGIPKRILTGSEMGELASSQDRDNWRDQVNGRREQHAEPFILRRLVDRLVEYGWLPTPKKSKDAQEADAAWEAVWGSVLNKTTEERDSQLTAMCTAKTDEGPVFTNAEIRRETYDWAPLDDEQKQALADDKVAQSELDAELEANKAEKVGTVEQKLMAAAGIDPELVEALRVAIEAGDDAVVLEVLAEATANA
jgi:hypothetical protein